MGVSVYKALTARNLTLRGRKKRRYGIPWPMMRVWLQVRQAGFMKVWGRGIVGWLFALAKASLSKEPAGRGLVQAVLRDAKEGGAW